MRIVERFKCLKKFAALAALTAVISSVNVVMAASGLAAYGSDTIAGHAAKLTISAGIPNKEVLFSVLKPSGSKVVIPAVTDAKGDAKIDLFDYHTTTAGIYRVTARYSGAQTDGQSSTFDVYPDQVSVEKSAIEVDKHIVKANGSDSVAVSAKLKDKYNNPLSRHRVMLISSKGSDAIDSKTDELTDSNGLIEFNVSTSAPGVSTFTAYDATDDIVLDSRVDVVFYDPNSPSVGGDEGLISFIPTAKAQSISGGPVSKFEITDIKEPVKVNDNVSFTVKAVDEQGNVSENYSGELRFSVEGAEANDVILPRDYEFTAQDLGVHTFSLGLSFKSVGSYKLVVTDVNSTAVKGERPISVVASADSVSGSNASDAAASSAGGPVIAIPRSGTYNKSDQTISGTATPGVALKVYDNDQEIGGTDADAQGNFSFKATQLADGEHKFKIIELDDSSQAKASSSIVTVSIDTTAPAAEDLIFDPNGPVAPGSLVKASLLSGGNLAQVALVVNSDLVVLSEDLGSPGTYKGSFVAPDQVGSFSVDVILVDSLGNEAKLDDQKQLVVAKSSGAIDNGDSLDGGLDNVIDGGDSKVSVVTGVKAFSGNNRVNLEWSPAAAEGIKNYRIYYGQRADSLLNTVDTFTNASKWYVPELENGKEYFFAITALSEEGGESAVRSEIVSAVPFQIDVTGVAVDGGDRLFGFDDGAASVVGNQPDALHAAAAEQPGLDKTGPEIYWVLLMSLGAAWCWHRKVRA